MSQTDVTAVADDGFVFGYPLVLMDRMRRQMSATASADPVRMRAPLNHFVHSRELGGATAGPATDSYADTLCSSAWLDLEPAPVVLEVPDTCGRFYVMSLADLWTNVFACVGARTTGCGAGMYVIEGPRRSGGAAVPADALSIIAPTRYVRIAGRTQVGGAGDVAAAIAVQRGFRLGVAPGASTVATAAAATADRTPPAEQIGRMHAPAFFTELTRLMRDNPPRLNDRRVIERMRAAGLLCETEPAWARLDVDVRRAATAGAHRGLERILAAAESPPGGWQIRYDIGEHGTDYLARAASACVGAEPGLAADELPAFVCSDSEGRPLSGRHRYELRFPGRRLPPVHGFWTLTTYDAQDSPADDSADRYSVCDWNGLTIEGDGSLTIRIQHSRPVDRRSSDWLPAPPERFNLLLRLVWPQDEALQREWVPPEVVRVG